MDTIIKHITAIGLTCILTLAVLVSIEPNSEVLSTINEETDKIISLIESKESIEIPEVNTPETTETQAPEMEVETMPEPVKPIQEPETINEPIKEEVVQEETKPEPVKEQPVEKPAPVQDTFEEPTMDNIKSIDRARQLTKDYCSEGLWHSWDDKKRKQYKNSDFIGLATRDMTVDWADEEYVETIDTVFIKLFISPELDGNIKKSTWTAWHECAHAKTYLIPVDKQEQVLQNIDKQFGDCNKHKNIECLADAMAQVKTGYEGYGYYQNSFTESELKLAEEIWNMSGIAQIETIYDVDAYNRIP